MLLLLALTVELDAFTELEEAGFEETVLLAGLEETVLLAGLEETVLLLLGRTLLREDELALLDEVLRTDELEDFVEVLAARSLAGCRVARVVDDFSMLEARDEAREDEVL